MPRLTVKGRATWGGSGGPNLNCVDANAHAFAHDDGQLQCYVRQNQREFFTTTPAGDIVSAQQRAQAGA